MHNPFDHGYYETPELRTFGFAYVGDNVRIAKNSTIVGLGNISIGHNSRIDSFCKIIVPEGRLTIGAFVHIAPSVLLVARGGIEIGDYAGLSHQVAVYSVNDDYSGEAMIGPCVDAALTNPTIAPVRIGRHCVVGASSVVFPGCDIGEGSITGAMTLVNRPLEPWGMHVGTPARRIRDRSQRCVALEADT